MGQAEQNGLNGAHIVWPKDTSWLFHVFQYLFGNISRSIISVSYGVLVVIKPNLLHIRWTWTSTHIPYLSNATVSTKLAVFLPTPGSSHSLSIVDGILPPNFSSRTVGSIFRCRAFVRKKPIGKISFSILRTVSFFKSSGVLTTLKRRFVTLVVIVSFVRALRIVVTRTLKESRVCS